MCEAAGKELFGHFKVGRRSLGSNASLFDGLKAEKVPACLSSLVRVARGRSRGCRRAWCCLGRAKRVWIQLSALLQIFGTLSKSLNSSLPLFPICKIWLKCRCLCSSKVLEMRALEIMKY